jgi:hypothetical protein
VVSAKQQYTALHSPRVRFQRLYESTRGVAAEVEVVAKLQYEWLVGQLSATVSGRKFYSELSARLVKTVA